MVFIVHHVLIVNNLKRDFIFSGTVITLITNCLTERMRSIFLNDILSGSVLVCMEVLQGSVLCPLLFTMFINDLQTVLSSCSYHIHVDEV